MYKCNFDGYMGNWQKNLKVAVFPKQCFVGQDVTGTGRTKTQHYGTIVRVKSVFDS